MVGLVATSVGGTVVGSVAYLYVFRFNRVVTARYDRHAPRLCYCVPLPLRDLRDILGPL